jgi:hypothetical protein
MAVWGIYDHEEGDLSDWDGSETSGTGNSIAVSSTRAKAGTYSVKVHIATVGKARCYDSNVIDVGSGEELWLSGWFYFPAAFDVDSGVNWGILYIQQSGSPYYNIRVDINDNEELFVHNRVNDTSYYQSSPISVPQDQWVGVELYVYVHDTNGIIQLWQDGVKIIDVTTIDTRAASNWRHCYAGCGWMSGTQTTDVDYWFDEVYVQDEQKIPPAPPAAVAVRLNPLGLRRFGGL